MSSDQQAAEAESRKREMRKLWRAWRTVHEMCQDRGYELAEDEVKISFDQFDLQFSDMEGFAKRGDMRFSARPSEAMIKKYTQPPTAAKPNPEPECGTIYVEFMTSSQIGVKEIKAFVGNCTTNNHKAGIMVTQGALSPQARKIINATIQYTQIECFMQDDLLINIMHHELVPAHVVLSKEEKTALLARYRLKETQLPRILQKDPVARYLGLKRGSVVKIIRTSETAGRYASYRLCV